VEPAEHGTVVHGLLSTVRHGTGHRDLSGAHQSQRKSQKDVLTLASTLGWTLLQNTAVLHPRDDPSFPRPLLLLSNLVPVLVRRQSRPNSGLWIWGKSRQKKHYSGSDARHGRHRLHRLLVRLLRQKTRWFSRGGSASKTN